MFHRQNHWLKFSRTCANFHGGRDNTQVTKTYALQAYPSDIFILPLSLNLFEISHIGVFFQVDDEQLKKILNLIESGVKQGARLVCGGKRRGTKGYFVEPTVFADVKDDMRIAKEEIFGPVQQILKFKTLDEVIERANDTTYGLGSGVVTQNINTAITFAQAVKAGSVW